MTECFICNEPVEKDDFTMETILYGKIHWDCWEEAD